MLLSLRQAYYPKSNVGDQENLALLKLRRDIVEIDIDIELVKIFIEVEVVVLNLEGNEEALAKLMKNRTLS